jgi:hypothetical protein
MARAKKYKLGCMTIILVAGLVAAGLLRLQQWISPPDDPKVLIVADDLVRINDPNDERVAEDLLPILPQKTFGGSVRVVGVYKTGTENLPPGTIIVVYQKDGWRFVEIDYLPKTDQDTVLRQLSIYPKETIQLNKTISGTIVNTKPILDCVEARTQSGVGTCQFTRVLVFDLKPGLTVRIAVDGNHASDGELIEMARSIANRTIANDIDAPKIE